MENQFRAVGMLIDDLRKGRMLKTDGILEELRDYFREITLQLGYAWYQQVEWLDYLLEFHLAEADRLRGFVVFEEGKDYPAIRAVLYEEFTLLIGRIEGMVGGKYEDLMIEDKEG